MINKENYNPDILTCLANLSSDEVFTPPKIANEMLDLLPQELFQSEKTTFLDPCTKSGVFLREIVKRLLVGLEAKIPDLQERINHIMKNQVFGIGITQLTSLTSRRSLYCSKIADGEYSSATCFENDQGNIHFKLVEHEWKDDRCIWCGASRSELDRDKDLETHAYEFIHTNEPQRIFNMKFDVIIGNPPYQLATGGAQAQAIPLYHKFVEQAKKLDPRYISMIIPSRWFTGGFGLDNFRESMLKDPHLSHLTDYLHANECFNNVKIEGGVCYFLWDKAHKGPCSVTTINGSEKQSMRRTLLESGTDVFVRYNVGVEILRKILIKKEKSISEIVSSQKPFDLPTNFTNFKKSPEKNSIKLYANKSEGFILKEKITKNIDLIGKHKVYISAGYGMGSKYPAQVLNRPFVGEPESCCTETYILIGPLKNKKESENLVSYINTRFFRFLVLLRKNTQHALKKVYKFVPLQDFSEPWTDEKLYKKYKLTKEEIEFIESMVRPME